MKPRIGLFAGDPSGIGPEVAAKLLAEPETHALAEIVAIGDAGPVCPTAQPSRIAGEYTIGTLLAAAELTASILRVRTVLPLSQMIRFFI